MRKTSEMLIRDVVAAQALPAVIALYGPLLRDDMTDATVTRAIALSCYAIADSMLKVGEEEQARIKRGGV